MALIDLTLIPFGLREEDACLVDVSHVERGRKCDCICPSCKTPLIARQGEVNQWHFAHASRSVYEKTDKECDYSFFVSVRLMARQVIGNSLEIRLPTFEGVASLSIEKTGDYLTEQFIVTKEKRIRIENIEIEKEFCGVAVDVYGTVDGYPIVLYFTHPGRVIPHDFRTQKGKKYGIVEVSLSDTYSLFIDDRNKEQSYLEKLRLFLAEDVVSKHWVYHPRYQHILERAEQTLAAHQDKLLQRLNRACHSTPCVALNAHSESGKKAKSEVKKREVKYQCLMCGTSWIGVEPGYSQCPKCNTHLFGKRVGYVDNET